MLATGRSYWEVTVEIFGHMQILKLHLQIFFIRHKNRGYIHVNSALYKYWVFYVSYLSSLSQSSVKQGTSTTLTTWVLCLSSLHSLLKIIVEMFNFQPDEMNQDESDSYLFYFFPPCGVFSSTNEINPQMNSTVNYDFVLLCTNHQTLAVLLFRSTEVQSQRCCKQSCRTFSTKVGLKSAGAGCTKCLALTMCKHGLSKRKTLARSRLKYNHPKARKCSSFVSLAEQNLLLSLN